MQLKSKLDNQNKFSSTKTFWYYYSL